MSGPNPTAPSSQLPYWQINVPPNQRTEHCPPFLQNISDLDRGQLMVRDEDFHRMSWDDVQDIIAKNDLGKLARVPSDLRRYIEWRPKSRAQYEAITMQERLRWTSPPTSSGDAPFSNPADYKILMNDWPYGVDKDIAHLVVWTKFPFPKISDAGDITPSTRAMLEDFVVELFCKAGQMDRSRVGWFKNWTVLQSLPGIEHFHVMLYKPDEAFLDKITYGDRSRQKAIEMARLGDISTPSEA